MDHRTRTEEEQRLEERVCEHVENSRSKRADAKRQEHISQLRDSGVGQHAFDVVLHQRNGRSKNGSECADNGHGFHRARSQHEYGIRARHHVHARRHHRRGMDQR